MPQGQLDRVRDVAWFRNANGTYTVTWIDDGELQVETFQTEAAAITFADLLDSFPTEEERLAAEAAIRELEAMMVEFGSQPMTKRELFEREHAYASLHD